jgi:hypothetical protein
MKIYESSVCVSLRDCERFPGKTGKNSIKKIRRASSMRISRSKALFEFEMFFV